MATSCNNTELATTEPRKNGFRYSFQIIGEDGSPKVIHDNKWVVMEDVECYSIRIRQKCTDKSSTSGWIPCANVKIDDENVGLLVLDQETLDVDRFIQNGDVVSFVACRQQESKVGRPSAFRNVSTDDMGLIRLEFGMCRDSRFGDCEAYTVTGEIPKACKFTSEDVKPYLKGLDLQGRKGGFDDTDCRDRATPTIAGGLIRLGDDNTRKLAQELFRRCAVTWYTIAQLHDK